MSRLAWVVAMIGVAVALTACTLSTTRLHTPVSVASVPVKSGLTPSSTQTLRAPVAPRAACAVSLPATWKAELEERYLRTSSVAIRDIELANDKGELVFEGGNTGGPNLQDKVLWWYDHKLRSRRTIMTLTGVHDRGQVFSTATDGNLVVFTLLRSLESYDDWDMWMWDPGSDLPPRQIAEADHFPDGEPVPTPQVQPFIHDGYVIWLQAKASTPERTSVFRYNIADGSVRELYSGVARSLYVNRSTVILAEGNAESSYTKFTLIDERTGSKKAVPRQLLQVRGIVYPVAQGGFYAWVDPNGNLMGWQPGQTKPVMILRAKELYQSDDDSHPIQFLYMAGPLIVFNINGEGFALDRRTWSYASLGGSFPIAWGDYVWVSPFSAMDRVNSQMVAVGSYFLPTSGLSPLPSCAGRG